MPDETNGNVLMRSQLFHAAIGYLFRQWPEAVTLTPSTFESDFMLSDSIFVEIVQDLIDEGMITVEFFVIGGAVEPVARGTLLTRKGAERRSDS